MTNDNRDNRDNREMNTTGWVSIVAIILLVIIGGVLLFRWGNNQTNLPDVDIGIPDTGVSTSTL